MREEARKQPAPEGVSWGTTNIPVDKRIDLSKTYATRAGIPVHGLRIKLHNGLGNEVSYPVKGSIKKKGHSPRYQIWTLDGRTLASSECSDDLVEKEAT